MKFRGIRPYAGGDTIEWLRHELNQALNDLFTGLKKLTIGENTESFEWYGNMTAGQEIEIANQLSFVPGKIVTLDLDAGAIVGRGSIKWSQQSLCIKNFGDAANVRVLFLR